MTENFDQLRLEQWRQNVLPVESAERLKSLANSAGSVFELVDCTSDETYFPMGLFLSLEDALDQVRDCKSPPTDDPEEFVQMEVRERQIGKLSLWNNGKTVATIKWMQDYIETSDEWVWHTPTISLANNESGNPETTKGDL